MHSERLDPATITESPTYREILEQACRRRGIDIVTLWADMVANPTKYYPKAVNQARLMIEEVRQCRGH